MRAIRSALRLALIAACALVVPQSVVQAQQPVTAAIANVPFTFQIGRYHYRAGTYVIRLQGDHVLTLRGNAGSGVMEVNWDATKLPSTSGELIFHRYGDQYFLRQLHIGGSSDFLNSPQSKEERALQKEMVEAEKRPGLDRVSNASIALAWEHSTN